MKLSALSSALILILTLAGCSEQPAPGPTSSPALNDSNVQEEEAIPGISGVQSSSITSNVADGLAFMREEEKLARDVYRALAAKWKLREFSNIAQSEQRHMDAIKTLLNRYALEDPAAKTAQGVFVNDELQGLYHTLLQQGLRSVTDAYQVGKLIEETDIADLDVHIAGLTTELDIRRVYGNLRQGSVQHLATFKRRL